MIPQIGFPRSSAELVKNTSTVSPTTLATVKDVLDNLGGRTPSALPVPIAEGGTGQITALAGFDALSTVTSTTFGRALLALADQAAFNALVPLAYGIYTPTLFNTTNIGASTTFEARYQRIGNVVFVEGIFAADATAAAGTVTVLGVSLPIPSNFAAPDDCGGSATLTSSPCVVQADATNDRAQIVWLSATTANASGGFSFSYEII